MTGVQTCALPISVVYVDGKCFAIEVIGRRYSQKTIDNKVANGNKIAGEAILI